MLNVEGISTEAKIGKILILVAIVIGLLVIIALAIVAAFIYTAGSVSGFGANLTIPLLIIIPLLALKVVGLIIGFFALGSTEKKDFNRAGILAIISSVLPPLDLIMLIGGIFCLVSREANQERAPAELVPS
ncbi:putative integral membrane protein [Methanolinea mesophila]|uniref:hypothetical protein n=1 Tax=Methanolinea mesophila TaxID=547055 RepID=UPI001AE2475B|nr:hypothetical protein [Methanolinea mesophila]MBP1927575.1 putative integral membrane protein [Methanolinea mesophila]